LRRATKKNTQPRQNDTFEFVCMYIYNTLASFAMVRVGGMTRPFSRSAGCIMSGCKCGGRSGRICPATKNISHSITLALMDL
jgi:hypothetical protein